MYKPTDREHVIVRAIDTFGEPKWTSGRTTGETGQYGEHFEVLTESPLIESDKGMYHYEDIKDATDENLEKHFGV